MEFRGGKVLYGRQVHKEAPEAPDRDTDVPQWLRQLPNEPVDREFHQALIFSIAIGQ
jgi:hypothetical protein